MAQKILETTNPTQVKLDAPQIKRVGPEEWAEWESKKVNIMAEGLILKYNENKAMQEVLLNSHPMVLVECSPHDLFWGTGKDIQEVIH